MIDPSVLPGFVALIMVFLIPPGPDMAYTVAVALEGGRRAAVLAIGGIGTGMSLYAAIVVVGVGAVVRDHPMLLDVIKVLGALYLLRLAWVGARGARRSVARVSVPDGRRYARGILVSLTNPKVVMFFLAVLPQFVGTAAWVGLQLAMLGAVTVLLEVALYGVIGVVAGGLRSRFTASPRAGAVLHVVAAGVYAVLAVVLGIDAVGRIVSG